MAKKKNQVDKNKIVKTVVITSLVIIVCLICFFASSSKSIEYSKTNSTTSTTEDENSVLEQATKDAGNVSDDDLLYIKKLALNNKKIVGIGEIGLDYYHNKKNRIDQINLFKKQLALAEELSLPVVIHSRDAVKDTIDCISSYNVKGVIHCFNGSLETANIYIKKGFKLGIGGVITFKHCKLGDVVENIALENIVLETDSPYLTPEPYRGKVNSSKYIPIIANKIASLHSCDIKLVEKITTNNVFDIFNL